MYFLRSVTGGIINYNSFLDNYYKILSFKLSNQGLNRVITIFIRVHSYII